ncbi:hypothetical protein F5148DRAFT_121447 [Russula earlei]|uniref:Uncharacterized protein n=1 Tax=Russula earlei TaxID=71964 RepID=A0ACC0TQW2_9AGAM|nr:hypothetical protein F5148DRAFT_121447 [Russula earlei]
MKAVEMCNRLCTKHQREPMGLPPAEPVSRPATTAPISFAMIQQLQGSSQSPNTGMKERRPVRDIQTEEAKLQAEAEFMMWCTAEEERIRVKNEARAALLMRPPQKEPQSQRQHCLAEGGTRNLLCPRPRKENSNPGIVRKHHRTGESRNIIRWQGEIHLTGK